MNPRVRRTFTTTATPEAAYDYLADFSNAEEWDPGTQECTRLEGDGGVGTRYRNVSQFLGRTTELSYTLVEADRPGHLHFEGTAPGFHGHDRLWFRPLGAGTEVTYAAEFAFSGLRALVAVPLVQLYLPVLARKTLAQLQGRLDRLSTGSSSD